MSKIKRYLLGGSVILLLAMVTQIGLNWEEVYSLVVQTFTNILYGFLELCIPLVGIGLIISPLKRR